MLAWLTAPGAASLPADYAADILYEDRLCIVAGGDNPWLRRRKIDFKKLAEEPWVIGLFDSPGMLRVTEMFRTHGAEPPKRYVATFSAHLRNNLAAGGRFIATMAESTFDRAAPRFGLKMLPIELPSPRWSVAAVTLRNRNLSPVVNLFLDCARDVAKSRQNSRKTGAVA